MRERKTFKGYLYACDSHDVGELVRLVGPDEKKALVILNATVPHATNCWIRGCQHEVSQVRLVEVQKDEIKAEPHGQELIGRTPKWQEDAFAGQPEKEQPR